MQAHTHDETCGERLTEPDRSDRGLAIEVGPRGGWASVRDTVGAGVGAALGIAPHVLHHIGLLAGTAVVTGASGNALFYVVGLLFSVPMLRRLYRHFGSWWAPAIAVGVFTIAFSVSAFVIGPAISSTEDAPPPTSPSQPAPSPTDHDSHH